MKSIESFVDNDEINYRFIIKRKDVVTTENVIKEEYLKQHILVNNPRKAMEPAAMNVNELRPNAVKDMKSIWNENTTPVDAAPLPSNTKIDGKKVIDQSPKEFFTDIGREFEPIGQVEDTVSRPRKMDVSALADVMESFNLKRGTSATDQHQSQQQQQHLHQMSSNPVQKHYHLFYPIFHGTKLSQIFMYIFSLINGSAANWYQRKNIQWNPMGWRQCQMRMDSIENSSTSQDDQIAIVPAYV